MSIERAELADELEQRIVTVLRKHGLLQPTTAAASPERDILDKPPASPERPAPTVGERVAGEMVTVADHDSGGYVVRVAGWSARTYADRWAADAYAAKLRQPIACAITAARADAAAEERERCAAVVEREGAGSVTRMERLAAAIRRRGD